MCPGEQRHRLVPAPRLSDDLHPGSSARSIRRPSRASGSSSTTATSLAQARTTSGPRKGIPSSDSTPPSDPVGHAEAVADRGRGAAAARARSAAPHPRETRRRAGAPRRCRRTRQDQLLALAHRGHLHRATGDGRRRCRAARVLRQRLQDQARDTAPRECRGDAHLDPQPSGKRICCSTGSARGSPAPAGAAPPAADGGQREPEQVAQSGDHPHRGVALALPDEHGDRVQGVEEEVRMELDPERVELGLGQLGLETRAGQLLCPSLRRRSMARSTLRSSRRPACPGRRSSDRVQQRLAERQPLQAVRADDRVTAARAPLLEDDEAAQVTT
jgi:hypothetical protein